MARDLKYTRNIELQHIDAENYNYRENPVYGGVNHKIGRFMMVLLLWIGWSKNKKEE